MASFHSNAHFFTSDNHQIHQITYSPPATFVTEVHQANIVKNMSPQQTHDFAISFLSSEIKIQPNELQVNNHYVDVWDHFYFDHIVNDKPVKNHAASLMVKDGTVLSYSYNFQDKPKLKKCTGEISETKALENAKEHVKGCSVDESRGIEHVYLDTKDGLVPAYWFQMNNCKDDKMLQVGVDACSGEVIYLFNYFVN
ncbi:hypothetical protein BC833DRAFT_621137 [Globomyces pollinis-pini]|nr:hypothetical protein BC833DRAFT_621137 [Globomyces pollinis-pini]